VVWVRAVRRTAPIPSLLIGAALGVGAFLYLRSFPPTLNPNDESFTLYSAKRLFLGEVLYRDVFEFIGPVTYWLLGLAYAVGGVTLHAAKVAMALANAASVVLTYALARRVAGRLEAAVAALVFLAVCLANFRLVSAHWLSTTLCLTTATILLAERWHDSERLGPFLAGAAGGLVFCNQQQRGTAMVLWLGAATLVLALTGGGGRRLVRMGAHVTGGWLAVTVPILGYCVWRAGWASFHDAFIHYVLQGYGPTFVGTVPWAGIAIGTVDYTWPRFLRALPWVLEVEAVLLGARLVWNRGRAEAVRASLLLLGATMTASVLYFPDLYHVGFIAPFTLVVGAGIVHRLRERAAAVPGLGAAIALGVVVLGGAAVRQARAAMVLAWTNDPIVRETAFGPMATRNVFAHNFDAIHAAVAVVPPEQRTLLSYPFDAWLYLTLPARNPTPFSCLNKSMARFPEYFARVEQTLQEGRADFVVVNQWAAPGKPGPFDRVLAGRYRPLQTEALFYAVYERNDGP